MKYKSDVTVIIPCYNDGNYIQQALDSVLRQTVAVAKIIVVDDGSDAATKQILSTLNHPNLEVIYQENQGVSVARNTAIESATTTFIVNLDADDYYEPTFIEKALDIINSKPNVGVVGCYYTKFNGYQKHQLIYKPLGGTVKDFIIKNNGLGNALFRKKCWEEVGGYDLKMVNGYEDWEFWIAILKNNWKMEIIEEPLFNYRIKSSSRDKTALHKHDFELRKYIFLKHKEVYLAHLDYYTLEILRINSVLKNNVHKFKNSREYKIGFLVLKPFRWIKNSLKKRQI